jgi:hypothetical protein
MDEILVELVEAALPKLSLPGVPVLCESQSPGREAVGSYPPCLL